MTTHGFMLGKFMPPHAGHLFACEVGLACVDVMTVLVCSHRAEPIDGFVRAQWMQACLPDAGYRVVHMHRDIPQTPKEHPDFWDIWRAAIAEHHAEPVDWVFGSEPYIHRLAAELQARPFAVDPERRVVPISARAIRADPAAHWAHVPGPVRPYFQRRITLVGAESTGKTTLAERLAADTQSPIVPEYGRDYDALFRHGDTWVAADFMAIARGHRAIARAMARRAGPALVEDTDLLQTLVWAEAILGAVPDDLVAFADRQDGPRTHYLLLSPETPWLDDGTRHFADQDRRQWFTERLRHWLRRSGAEWTEITGSDWQARETAAHKAVSRITGRAATGIDTQ